MVANDVDCDIIVNVFKLQLCYYIHFQNNTLRKGMNPLIQPSMVYIVLLLFFYKDGFGIKLSIKIDMPLNKETNPRNFAKKS